jgi:Domain of unknown function (DUF6265)
MRPKKDIFDLFRDNQHKLNERPSHQAWERLESRLDERKNRSRTSIYRILSMAAAVLVLVVFVSVISFVLNTKADRMTTNEYMPKLFETEELKVLTVSSENDYQIATYQKKYNNHLSSPIMEGKANKKLIARMDMQRRNGNLNTFLEKNRREKEHSLATVSPNVTTESFQPSITVEFNDKNETYTESEAIDVYDSISAEESSIEVAASGMTELDDEKVAEDEKKEIVKDIETTPMSKAKRQYAAPFANKKLDQTFETEGLLNEGSTVGQNNSSNAGIQQFQWLTGKWKGTINNQVSIEQWNQVDAQTLEGRGFLMTNGLSVFNENMKVQEINGVVYFIADLNGTGNPIYYQLISNDGFQAIFENKTIDFPNQVVLQRINSSNFSTIYQNTEPGYIKESQQNYYLNRNYIQKEQVIRNLRRVND